MKRVFYLILISALSFTEGCAQKGFVKKGNMETNDSSLPLLDQAEAANKGQYGIAYRSLKTNETPLADSLPVGAIIAFAGQFNFSDQWQIAMGQTINDPTSPLNGKKVPDLNGAFSPFEASYLAGTLDSGTYNTKFGQNTIPADGQHTPSGNVTLNHGSPHPNGWDDRSTSNHLINTDLRMNPISAHTHNGDNRPRTHGVVFLIKIK